MTGLILLVLCLYWPISLADVQCNDGSSCPDGSTCCETSSGGYGCCPALNATCCSDHIHCCPPEYPVCDIVHQQCTNSFVYAGIALLRKRFPDNTALPSFGSIDCGDGISCNNNETCCKTTSGGYGCCESADATCCSDHIHCCPPAYPICDLYHGQCTNTDEQIVVHVPMLEKKPAKYMKLKDIQCGDGTACPSNTYCCPSGFGGFGCCAVEIAAQKTQ